MKIYICGYARHGKDTVAEILHRRYGLRHDSSSRIALRSFVRGALEAHGLKYATEAECYEDRVNHRALWFNIIKQYGEGDPARLSRLIFQDNDIYVGIRNAEELHAAQREGLSDLTVWVDASKRLGTVEGADSNTITPDDCDLIIPNNGNLLGLGYRISRIFDPMFIKE